MVLLLFAVWNIIMLTIVCFDPPFRPLTETANFTADTENLFNDEEPIELAEFVECMHKKSVKVVVSNLERNGVIVL